MRVSIVKELSSKGLGGPVATHFVSTFRQQAVEWVPLGVPLFAEVQGLPTGQGEEILVSTSDGAALLSGHPSPLQNKLLLPINAGLSINKCLLSFLGDDKQPKCQSLYTCEPRVQLYSEGMV